MSHHGISPFWSMSGKRWSTSGAGGVGGTSLGSILALPLSSSGTWFAPALSMTFHFTLCSPYSFMKPWNAYSHLSISRWCGMKFQSVASRRTKP